CARRAGGKGYWYFDVW
nr:immunoglobulin heavy chain junction region [Mus musculus]